MIETPIVVVFFNRPESIRRLYSRLVEVQPATLYLICDGARTNKPDEWKLVDDSRLVFDNVPWKCKVHKNYSDVNLGCRQRIISGLDWVFKQEERAIILEDDCIPITDFFPFAEEMLEAYKNDTRILSVGGTNLCPSLSWPEYSITFSRYPMIWGWATWSRAWKLMDRDMKLLSWSKQKHILRYELGSKRAEWYWNYLFGKVQTSWGYRWAFTSFLNHGLHLLPKKNLISNIGMDSANATHTRRNPYDLPQVVPEFPKPYSLPDFVAENGMFDAWIENHIFSRSLFPRLDWIIKGCRQKIKAILKK